ncbi:MAG: DHH family phosphoesterase, partial [Candidatus Cloacimonadaceae bacterium]|nr:DHH family phosphoesterase [Candidatus Cloacimonadota bacterium]
MDKKWLIPPGLNAEENEAVEQLCAQTKAPRLIAELLYRRGLRNEDEIQEFFNPNLAHLADPYLFEDMDKAVTRILAAVESKELITIYGDYDVDGTTATALLYLGLKRIGAQIDFYIPHRMIDGYGLSLGSLDQLRENGSKLIVSVDCGVNALEEIRAM